MVTWGGSADSNPCVLPPFMFNDKYLSSKMNLCVPKESFSGRCILIHACDGRPLLLDLLHLNTYSQCVQARWKIETYMAYKQQHTVPEYSQTVKLYTELHILAKWKKWWQVIWLLYSRSFVLSLHSMTCLDLHLTVKHNIYVKVQCENCAFHWHIQSPCFVRFYFYYLIYISI